ncbi:MAG TPA: proline dehydrogenase family protein [Terriglobales bacterium]|jgi:proline dehydrogenase|nr:proline dehydrogenase family protein [Terriglobales bacterium]
MLRELFIGLSTSRALRAFAERSSIGQKMSRRFVAGTTIEELLSAAESVNAKGMTVSVDNLGENVTNAAEAEASAQLYHRLLDLLTQRKLKANVSLKLTHMGLDVDSKLCEKLVCALVDHAKKVDNFVRVDMEGSPYTQRTLDFVHELHAHYPGHTGAVLQSYMRRSEADAEKLISDKIRIRLCKGAYKEPPEVAFQKKSEVDANYVKLAKILLKSGVYHGIATHDEKIIQQVMLFAEKEKIARNSFEFQMLYGIRRDLQERIVREGWGMRVYIPFGTEWYPYLMRRLAERPANVFFIAKNILRG